MLTFSFSFRPLFIIRPWWTVLISPVDLFKSRIPPYFLRVEIGFLSIIKRKTLPFNFLSWDVSLACFNQTLFIGAISPVLEGFLPFTISVWNDNPSLSFSAKMKQNIVKRVIAARCALPAISVGSESFEKSFEILLYYSLLRRLQIRRRTKHKFWFWIQNIIL